MKYKKFVILTIIFIMAFSPVLGVVAQENIDITNIKVIDIDGKSVKIEWSTNVATNGKIIFGGSKDKLSAYIIDGRETSQYHYTTIGNLKADTKYYYKIIASNNSEQVQSYVKEFETTDFDDGKRPVISNAKISYISGTTAVITWTTDKDANSKVEYDYNETYKKTDGSNTRVTDHSVTIKKLEIGTNYKLRLYSVDKNKNNSGYIYKTFTTRQSDTQDKEELVVSRLRPSGNNDSQISSDTIKATFKTNHYAKGSISLRGEKIKTKTKDIEYDTNHEIYFPGLTPNTEYDIFIEMKDIFGKKVKTEILEIKTSAIKIVNVTCDTDTTEIFGYYGQYFNLDASHSTIRNSRSEIDRDWFNKKYLSFTNVDYNLDFGNGFFPVDEGLKGDPYYFSVYWKANIIMDEDEDFNYKVYSDDDSWVYIDGTLKTDLGGKHKVKGKTESVELTEGSHLLEIYFVERGPTKSHFSFIPDGDYEINPIVDCPSTLNQEVAVKGVEFSTYTSATALYKEVGSSRVFSIINNQRHYITTPASFNEYGFSWDNIKIVSNTTLQKYSTAKLVKNSDNSSIYYLYEVNGKTMKIKIPSPTVFNSYPNNSWDKVVKITQIDIDSYGAVKLVKTKDDSAVYYLENGEKHFVSEMVFRSRGFNFGDIMTVNKIHLDSYKIGAPLQ